MLFFCPRQYLCYLVVWPRERCASAPSCMCIRMAWYFVRGALTYRWYERSLLRKIRKELYVSFGPRTRRRTQGGRLPGSRVCGPGHCLRLLARAWQRRKLSLCLSFRTLFFGYLGAVWQRLFAPENTKKVIAQGWRSDRWALLFRASHLSSLSSLLLDWLW